MPQTLTELRRLVSALEALSAEEQVLLQQRLYDEVNSLHLRELPLVTRIAELAARPAVRSKMEPELVQRIRRLIASFTAKSNQLDESMEETRLSLARLEEGQQRVRTLRPAYGSGFAQRAHYGAFAAEG